MIKQLKNRMWTNIHKTEVEWWNMNKYLQT